MHGRQRFHGRIAGVGSTSGVRVVVGRWDRSPMGAFADVMLEQPDGHRVLLAPDTAVAAFVSDTYVFDEVVVTGVDVSPVAGGMGQGWAVTAGELRLSFTLGRRAPLGWALRALPTPVASSTAFATAADPVARTLLRGVSTRGQARSGRREWYGALDLHRVTSLTGSWRGTDLGELAPVDPPCRFGFSSTPRAPGVTSVVTTVEVLAG
ncbi:hypothetical protein [Phycicoccus sp. Root101]|uniref:hypothetical protein n=1 Tax=Phycicoccus sp. Root101 TaxID=1736421 RepID=UPI0007031D22|nr:hypothetical protein [Phycicoccus sp. Root101]KQU65236.1 hypothetical protein ASC58_17175 [Phycicoccus sp. Root101]